MLFKSISEKNVLELLFQHHWYASKQKKVDTICDFFENSHSPLNVSISQVHPFIMRYANKQLLDYYGVHSNKNISTISWEIEHKLLHPNTKPRIYETVARIQKTSTVGNLFARVRRHRDKDEYTWRFCTMRILPGENLLFNVSVLVNKLFDIEQRIKHQTRISDYQKEYFQRFMALSGREREVLRLTMQGETNKATADQLYISLDTVKQHLQNIRKKAGLKNFAALMRFAQSFELV